MNKIATFVIIVSLFAACKQKVEDTISSAEVTVDTVATTVDTATPATTPSAPAGKLAAMATDEVVGEDGKIIAFTYDNNASTVSFELNGKQMVLTSKEKISDIPETEYRIYSNDEFTFESNKNGITIIDNKIIDKQNRIVFKSKN